MIIEDKYRTAIHEAGHAILLHSMGVEVSEVTIKKGEGYLGRTSHDEFERVWTMEESAEYFLDRICMLYGGAVAEFLEFGNCDEFGYAADMAEIDSMLCNFTDDQKKSLTETSVKKTEILLSMSWESVKIIADELMQKETLNKDDFKRIFT